MFKYMKPFWVRTKKLIKAVGMNQAKFAAFIDVPLGTFQGWIHHDRLPEAETAYYIATALGVSVEFLVSGKDKENTKTRLKELAARKAAGKIEVLTDKILVAVKSMGKPIP